MGRLVWLLIRVFVYVGGDIIVGGLIYRVGSRIYLVVLQGWYMLDRAVVVVLYAGILMFSYMCA